MGLDSRDYARGNDSSSWSGPPSSPRLFASAVSTLIVVNIAVFVAQLLVGGHRVEGWFSLYPELVLRGQLWRLTTYDFLHNPESIWHIVWNMYALWLAGTALEERVLGKREFIAFYLASGVISGLAYLVWAVAMNVGNPVLGASGAVAAVMLFYALKFPNDVWYIFGIIRVRVIVIAILTLILDLYPVLRQIGGGPPQGNVAHVAHLGGMLFGFLCYRYDWRVLSWFDGLNLHPIRAWQRWRTRRRFRVVRDDPPPRREPAPSLDAELDRVLAKVHESGQESLTPAEQAVLIEASRRYKR